MSTNELLIKDDFVEFIGFDLIKDRATICFYAGGISILPGWKKKNLSHYYEISLNSERKLYDKLLIKILKERGMTEKECFVCTKNNHYIELVPHGVPHV